MQRAFSQFGRPRRDAVAKMTDELVELGHDSAVALKVATSAAAGFTKEYNELGFAVRDSAELDVHHTKRYEAMVDSLSAAALVEQSMAAVPVLDREGQPTGVYTFNGSTAVRALEILGRHLGMFPTGPAVVVDNRKQELQEFTIN